MTEEWLETDSGMLGLRSHENRDVTGEHECKETGIIWEWMILIINDDRQMMEIINIQKQKEAREF